ncbi:MAG: GNAT family N-acetyltransferase [Methanobacterium sp.]|jgi:ribosomal protein S18 acetylase RimI-like enzyme
MKFEKLDLKRHDLNKVSKLIYETELGVFRSLLGKDEDEATQNIKRLVKAGSNSLGHENIHVAINGDVIGILVSFSGKETSLLKDFKAYYKILNFTQFLKYIFKGIAINELLTTSVGRNDYYLSNIAADTAFRGQGIGSYILENAIKLAEDAKCRRLILDVTMDNEGALRLYERFGFKVYGKNSPEWIFKGKGTLSMELII